MDAGADEAADEADSTEGCVPLRLPLSSSLEKLLMEGIVEEEGAAGCGETLEPWASRNGESLGGGPPHCAGSMSALLEGAELAAAGLLNLGGGS